MVKKWNYNHDGVSNGLEMQAMETMVASLDRDHLRPLQKESYLCMAKCCDSANTPADLKNWYEK